MAKQHTSPTPPTETPDPAPHTLNGQADQPMPDAIPDAVPESQAGVGEAILRLVEKLARRVQVLENVQVTYLANPERTSTDKDLCFDLLRRMNDKHIQD
jgi:hypothetical protein